MHGNFVDEDQHVRTMPNRQQYYNKPQIQRLTAVCEAGNQSHVPSRQLCCVFIETPTAIQTYEWLKHLDQLLTLYRTVT